MEIIEIHACNTVLGYQRITSTFCIYTCVCVCFKHISAIHTYTFIYIYIYTTYIHNWSRRGIPIVLNYQ